VAKIPGKLDVVNRQRGDRVDERGAERTFTTGTEKKTYRKLPSGAHHRAPIRAPPGALRSLTSLIEKLLSVHLKKKGYLKG
jgi:hypothetical protein